jgi:hypothetical protein
MCLSCGSRSVVQLSTAWGTHAMDLTSIPPSPSHTMRFSSSATYDLFSGGPGLKRDRGLKNVRMNGNKV